MAIEQYNSTITARDSSDQLARTFPVDVEHTGIRIVLPVIMIVGGIALYLLASTQLLVAVPDLGAGAIGRQLLTALEYQMPDLFFEPVNAPFLWYASGFIALVVGLIGALLIGAIADRLLKRYWPSGRTLAWDGKALRLRNTRGIPSEVVVTLDRRVNIVTWHFAVQRSSPRAQRGWHMLAYQILQDDSQIILYTFMTPKAFAALPGADRFVELKANPVVRPGRRNTNVQALRVSSEQKRLDTVEAARLEVGAELRPADFAVVLNAVPPHLDMRSVTASASSTASAKVSITSLRKD